MRPAVAAPGAALGASLVLGVLCAGCRGSLPQPAAAPQPDNAFVRVPYPPPPARVETAPKRPTAAALWVDGQWSWDGQWTWMPGGWVIPPPGGRLARWALRLEASGRLEFAPASWRDASGRELPPARVVAAALGEASNQTLPVRCAP